MVSGCFLLLALGPLQVGAPEVRSYPPNTITVTTGTGTGTVDDLYTVDGMVYDVAEEDVGASSTLTATEEWIVQGTLDSGIFPDDTETQDGTGVVYLEGDDDLGALTGDNRLLTPTADGTYYRWESTAGDYLEVDDDPPHDANTTYMFTTQNDWITDTFVMEDLPVLPVGTKESGTVTVFSWAAEVNDAQANNTLITHSTLYAEGTQALTTTYVNNTWVHVTNPNTGSEWTHAEINVMEVGISAIVTAGDARCTSVGAVVPLQYINYVLDVRHNVTAVPAGREYYVLTVRALTAPGEDVTVSVYDHVAPGWDTAFVITNDTYDTRTFGLTEADHVNAGEVWLRYTDAGGDTVAPDGFDIDLLNVRAYNVEYALEISFQWIGLDDYHDPHLSLEGYRSDTETISLHVWRSGTWFTLDTDSLAQGTSTSRSYDLAPADVIAGTLEVRLIDNDQADNDQTTIFLNWLSLTVEIRSGSPRAPVDVYAGVSYDLWGNDVLLSVRWVQVGGPEPAQELGRYATLWADGVVVGTYEVHGDKSTRVSAPWSYFDGEEHTLNVTGAVAIAWPTFGGNQTYYSDPASEDVENLPRWAVLVLILCMVLTIVAALCVRAVKSTYEEEPND